ncbi:uncharacterized protein LOC107263061 [Cephus cinctus]|uniref:Uncharacterized protein LOC107263061 n=1 Tax=Cephus cinctus TaxID=211228 RepID=A0AAJ7BGB1_CEPCN|nr:uncharacterized protein LOC107263061 [Cephus cinctus]XP_015585364.1 uncharacterized protein LOC107263061 [Cephus cinctus]XP_024936195.1 uncharacterized protein LOC107263061 [Cephus cinctus]
MRLPRIEILLLFVGLVACKNDEGDAANAFMEAAEALFNDKEAMTGLHNMASAFMESDAGKQIGGMLSGGKGNSDGVSQILSGIGNLISASTNSQGGEQKSKREARSDDGGGFDLESMLNMANMFLGQNANSEGLMGLLPMVLENIGSSGSSNDVGSKKQDHSNHSWFLPPFLENLHVMWEHFSNSELGQTLWKNSGLANIVGLMTDKEGNIQYAKILNSFENPALRRRWVKSLTNFISEWISHVSDPATQQRYLATGQFMVNSFLKSQGFPKSVMFDPSKPADSLSRLANAVAKRHLNMKIDSSKYIKPAIAYLQELMNLASKKGFIMSRVNAMELSNKLSELINNAILAPILKVYRAYKWSTKHPQCAKHILCVINEKSVETDKSAELRKAITKLASFAAAWGISRNVDISFWSLYGAIAEQQGCFEKYPGDCTAFHEEEIRVTTESIHSEL